MSPRYREPPPENTYTRREAPLNSNIFFSSRVTGDDGGDSSSTAIKAAIKQLVGAEDARKPLSDSKLCNLLKDQGISVARRTIAKYREQLAIRPSNERKRLN